MTEQEERERLRYLQLKKKKAESVASPSEESLFSKANRTAFGVAQTGMEALALPLELAGEALRTPIEQDRFRAPSLVQRFAPSTRTDQPPGIGVDTANKLLRASAGALSGIPSGTPLESAKAAYNADRGMLGAIEDTAAGLLVGRAAPSVANAPVEAFAESASKVAKGATRLASAIGKKGIRVALGPTEEAQSALLHRPDAVLAKTNFDDLSDEFASTLNGLQKKVEELDTEAWDSLLKLKSEPRSKIVNILKNVRRDFIGTGKTRIGDADRAAVAKIDDYIERVNSIRQQGTDSNLDQMLDQRQLREIVQSVRRDATFGGITDTPTNLAAKKVQGQLNAMLKENGNFREVMDRLAPATRALKEASLKFRLKREPGAGFVSSDTAAQKLSLLGREKKPETHRILDNLKRETGRDFQDEARLTGFKEQFRPGRKQTAGSRRAVVGGIMGESIGRSFGVPFLGGMAGASAGASMDYYGGSAAAKIIEALARSGSKVGGLLTEANAKAEGTTLQMLLQELMKKRLPAVAFTREAR